ncbi:MAG: hypothetical protein GSR80_001049 [Desulfurococcales archaeon]|nr:hypothetical protein [Desulfurococcales archaeon]
MACNMPARGDSLGFIEAGGRRLGELVEEAMRLARGRRYAKVSGLLDLEGEACEVALLLESGRVMAACVDCGSPRRGREALEELASRASQVVGRGYLEAMELTRDAVELDLEFEPQARLPQPLEAVGLPPREAKPPPPETLTPMERAVEAEAPGAGEGEESGPRGEAVEEGDSTELADLLIYMVSRSSIIDFGGDARALLRKAREASLGDEEAFYRAVAEVAGGRIYNAFYKDGKLCGVVILDTQRARASFLEGLGEEGLLERIAREGPARLYLYRVVCHECEEALLRGCVSREEQERPTSEPAAEAERARRPGLLRRLLGRWTS